MISAALDIQGERAHQQVGESSAVNAPSSKAISIPKALVPVASQNPNKKKVLFVTSEIADLVKTGGLGDVSAALPRAMAHLHDVRVLIPGYPQVLHSENPIHIIGELGGHAALPPCKIGRMDMPDGLVIYVLICPELYEREGSPYGANNGRDWPDNHIRFARLGLAAADIAANLAQIHWCPDLVHAHDWPAGLAPAYMHWRGQRTPTLFTIHNLAYQGVTSLGSCPNWASRCTHCNRKAWSSTARCRSSRPAWLIRATSPRSAPPTPRKSLRLPSAAASTVFLPPRPSKACSAGFPTASTRAGTPPPTRTCSARSPSATGTVKPSTPLTCASCSAWKHPKVRCSPWYRALSTRKVWTLPKPWPNSLSKTAARSQSSAVANRKKNKPCGCWPCASLARLACASASMKPTPAACSPAAISC